MDNPTWLVFGLWSHGFPDCVGIRRALRRCQPDARRCWPSDDPPTPLRSSVDTGAGDRGGTPAEFAVAACVSVPPPRSPGRPQTSITVVDSNASVTVARRSSRAWGLGGHGLWTLESGVSRLRGHPKGAERCQPGARRSSWRSSPKFPSLLVSYNAGNAGLVDGIGYLTRSWVVGFVE